MDVSLIFCFGYFISFPICCPFFSRSNMSICISIFSSKYLIGFFLFSNIYLISICDSCLCISFRYCKNSFRILYSNSIIPLSIINLSSCRPLSSIKNSCCCIMLVLVAFLCSMDCSKSLSFYHFIFLIGCFLGSSIRFSCCFLMSLSIFDLST